MNIVYIVTILICVFILFTIKKLQRNKRRKEKVITVDNEKCARCRSCITRCRHKVLEMKSTDQGLRVEVARPDLCTACGNCIEVCRFNALKLVNRN